MPSIVLALGWANLPSRAIVLAGFCAASVLAKSCSMAGVSLTTGFINRLDPLRVANRERTTVVEAGISEDVL